MRPAKEKVRRFPRPQQPAAKAEKLRQNQIQAIQEQLKAAQQHPLWNDFSTAFDDSQLDEDKPENYHENGFKLVVWEFYLKLSASLRQQLRQTQNTVILLKQKLTKQWQQDQDFLQYEDDRR